MFRICIQRIKIQSITDVGSLNIGTTLNIRTQQPGEQQPQQPGQEPGQQQPEPEPTPGGL